MRALTRGSGTAVVVALMLGAPAPALADETDNFTCRARLTRDSLRALDGLMNARIQAAITRANRRGETGCDALCLSFELQKHIAARSLDPLTLVPHARFEKWITQLPGLDRCHLDFSDTIYGVRPYDQPWLFPFHGRIIFVADSVLLSGRVVGLDKINHFIREGLEHWRDVSLRGRDIASVLGEELGSPRRPFRPTEYGLKGWSLTGVLAYADLAAGYSGFRFWTDLLSIGGPASYVARDASTGHFVQTRPFTFAAYVNDAWDEGINVSAFEPGLDREVAAALARRGFSLPVCDCGALASLPDARLYVNPACLGGSKWAPQDSNLRPTGYEPAALTAELGAPATRYNLQLTPHNVQLARHRGGVTGPAPPVVVAHLVLRHAARRVLCHQDDPSRRLRSH